MQSPIIKKISWGHLEIEGFDQPFKDAKLYPGGAREWDWNETATSHSPGIQPADIQELLDNGVKILILSQGVYGRLQTSDTTLDLLKERQIIYHQLKTGAAVKLYNKLRKTEAVGALIHSTC
ncbi:MAG: Mth938-like domain-containing protein [Fidelibacterota bacterium]